MGQQSLEALCSIGVSGWMASLDLVALGVQYEMVGQPGPRKQAPTRQRPGIRISLSILCLINQETYQFPTEPAARTAQQHIRGYGCRHFSI